MGVSRTLCVPGRFESLDALREFAGEAAREAGLDKDGVYAVQLAVDEACSNIIEHGYGSEDQGDIECNCVVEPSCVTVTIQDQGEQFDPTCAPQPDTACALQDRQAGGLGLFLIHKLMDDVRFEFTGSGNTVTLVKRQPDQPGPPSEEGAQ